MNLNIRPTGHPVELKSPSEVSVLSNADGIGTGRDSADVRKVADRRPLENVACDGRSRLAVQLRQEITAHACRFHDFAVYEQLQRRGLRNGPRRADSKR